MKFRNKMPHHSNSKINLFYIQFSRSVLSDSAIPWTAAHQASLSISNSRSPPKPMSIGLVMPSNHLILCRPLLLLPSIFPSIRVFSDESALQIRWPKYWSLSFMSLLLNMLSRLVLTFLPRSKHLLISWLQSPSAVILEPKEIKSDSFHCFPIYFPWSDGTRCHDLRFLNVEL